MVPMLKTIPLRIGMSLLVASLLLWAWVIWRIFWPGPPSAAADWVVGDWAVYNIATALYGHFIALAGSILGLVLSARILRRGMFKPGPIVTASIGYMLTAISYVPFRHCVFYLNDVAN